MLAACGARTEKVEPSEGGNAADSPDYLTCLNASGQVDPSLKTCRTQVDCSAMVEATDCCGSVLYVGVNNAFVGEFNACEAIQKDQLGQCMCQPKPTQTEDGRTVLVGPQVRCNLTTTGGICMTFSL